MNTRIIEIERHDETIEVTIQYILKETDTKDVYVDSEGIYYRMPAGIHPTSFEAMRLPQLRSRSLEHGNANFIHITPDRRICEMSGAEIVQK